MKIALSAVLALAASAVLAGCGAGGENDRSKPAPAPAPAAPPVPEAPAGAKAGYPLDTCVVSGEKLGSMGDPYVLMYEGTEVRFCCPKCEREFRKDPAKYLAKIRDAGQGR